MNSISVQIDRPIWLHGDLELSIKAARRVPNMDRWPPISLHARLNRSDPYVTVKLGGDTVARTRVIHDSTDPEWNEEFNLPLAHNGSKVVFELKDKDLIGKDDLIGTVEVRAKKIVSGKEIDEWFLVNGSPNCSLHLRMQFKPVEDNIDKSVPAPVSVQQNMYSREIPSAGGPDDHNLGVKHTYFPLRKAGKLRLYQDAHVKDDDKLPEIKLDNGKVFRHEKCWEDIYNAISKAQRLVYVVGWSIYDKVKLVRYENVRLLNGGTFTLGELLKYKSQEGVRVRLLVWDDKTSHDRLLFKTKGVASTHDEETKKFFKGSNVACVLSPRYADASSKSSVLRQQVVGTLYSHHQKCVIVDTTHPSQDQRQITAFVGGLDLCDGRYDTPEHTLFGDLNTVFKNDLRNPVIPTETKGPRQPWHDLHCRIDGPAAYDVLENFEQRWMKEAKNDALIDDIPTTLSGNASITDEDDPTENWHVQVFRSIGSESLKGFPQEARKANLIYKDKLVIDKSIHTAYVAAIRSAQHFIYIENQYFLGSSFGWPSPFKSSGANNLVPMEIALKIASKIKAKARFAVYVIIPMWPEGVPTDAAIQKILFWQYQTIQMMYDVIANELKSLDLGGAHAHPKDYLNFYCLGNREEVGRFMVHVNGKGMIVDDEYVILGSANINQRSLDGSKDTEIAIGAYQPHHSWSKKKSYPRGQVYGYRLSLWAEHLGMVENVVDIFKEADSLECLRRVNEIAECNWKKFCGEGTDKLEGHLMTYPITVGADGKVGTIRDYEEFPDVGGKILGTPAHLPDYLMI